MGITLSSFLYGLLGGMVAWIATAILSQPLYRFLGLRNETAQLLAQYEHPDVTRGGNMNTDWMATRTKLYQECGANLIAFSAGNRPLGILLEFCRFRPSAAGQDFITLASLSPGANARGFLKQQIASALRLRFSPPSAPHSGTASS